MPSELFLFSNMTLQAEWPCHSISWSYNYHYTMYE